MSTDQYPEATSADSGLQPQAPRMDWPKKIRTLSAAELDRLTIDGEGRFYWDGHLVNYQPPAPASRAAPTSEATDLDALALLDRAARELSGQPETPAAAATTAHVAPEPQAVAVSSAQDIQPGEAPPVSALAPSATAVATVTEVPQVAPMPMFDMPPRARNEKVRLRMSFWQSLALLVVIVGLLIGAAGIAISGLVAAHDWGCRTKLIDQYCPPPPPAPKPPARVDIPA